ncbi:unnamed protein product, partial [Arctogadus glacialis]
MLQHVQPILGEHGAPLLLPNSFSSQPLVFSTSPLSLFRPHPSPLLFSPLTKSYLCQSFTLYTAQRSAPAGVPHILSGSAVRAEFVIRGRTALGDSDFPTVLRQLLPMMKPMSKSGPAGPGDQRSSEDCGPEEMILLLIFLYSLADEAQPWPHQGREEEEEEELEKTERELIGALTLVITQEAELSPLLQKITGCVSVEEVTAPLVHSALERVFETLRGLTLLRDHLKHLKSVYTGSDGVHQASYQPFLEQVLQDVFHPDHRDCPDLEHMSGGLTDLLKTGFSMFMK